MLSELLHYVAISLQGVAYTILFAESQRDTAAGAAIAYSIKIMLAFDDGMDKASLVALP